MLQKVTPTGNHQYMGLCPPSVGTCDGAGEKETGNTLSPIIMEVENGYIIIEKVNYYWRDPFFHFHDYGRKGKVY